MNKLISEFLKRNAKVNRLKKRVPPNWGIYPRNAFMFWKNVMRERVQRTSKLVSFKVYRGDLHYHSTYGDGAATVHETKEWIDWAGLDFFFITDHWGVEQKRDCKKYKNLWWGQEPSTENYDIAVLGLDRKYTLKGGDIAYDYQKAQKVGGYAFIAHPTGWFPSKRYTDEQKDALNLLGEEFAIEIINGANQVFDCFDVTDEMTIELWDKHLCQGKRVTGVGNSDGHLPHGIGDVWTSVFCESLTKKNVLDALRRGHCFVSDAPMVNITLNNAQMGDMICLKANSTAAFHYECADTRGLFEIRIIKDGQCIKKISLIGKVKAKDTIKIRFDGGKSYYRLECFALDQRRAYSNPIYVREC